MVGVGVGVREGVVVEVVREGVVVRVWLCVVDVVAAVVAVAVAVAVVVVEVGVGVAVPRCSMRASSCRVGWMRRPVAQHWGWGGGGVGGEVGGEVRGETCKM